MKQPFFSIIIPVYNTQAYIARCLESCIQQTFKDIEILIIDDCGEDDSIQIAKEYAQKEQRIQIIHNAHNLGAFHSRLKGVERAQGEYCLFVDSDDFIELETCTILYSMLQKDVQIDILHFGMNYIPQTFKRTPPPIAQGYLMDEEMRNFISLNNSFQSLCDKAIKTPLLKEVYKSINLSHSLSVMEDGLVIMALSLKIKTYFGIKKQLYFYQNNPTSTTQTISKESFYKKCKDFGVLLDALRRLKKENPQFSHLIHSYEKKVLSAIFLEGRMYSYEEINFLLSFLADLGFSQKTPKLPPYLASCYLALRYFYRWQTIARIIVYIISFGKIKL